MTAGLHSAGAGSFQWPPRCIEPNITPGNHLAGDMDIIILNEHQLSLQIAIFAEVNDVLDVTLAIIIPRMRFARENKLDGPGFVSGQLDDILELLENQR